MKIRLMILAAMLGIATLAQAQTVPPSVFHYQGRLTGSGGSPVTSTQTFYFSIYVGGSATTANSGTLKYQESASITPDSNGIFEHLVGAGTKISGSIKATDFNTTQTIYLQVAVASTGNVLLPRTRFTTTPYSIVSSNAVGDITPKTVSIAGYGQVINSSGQWVGSPITAGAPYVSSITDTTGGPTVSGDLVRLSGSNLSKANVFIGGRQARVKSSSSSQVIFAVPAGLPMGLNQVTVTTGTLQAARFVGTIDVTRFLMLLSEDDNKILFVNPRTLTVVGTVSLTFGDWTSDSGALKHIQVDFARDGALMLVPDNRSSNVYAVDLTKNPPALVQTLSVSNVNRAAAVAVEPSESIVAVADAEGNKIRILNLNEQFPPFSAPISNASTITDLVPQPPTAFYPRALRFMSDQVLIADGSAGRLQIFQHRYDYKDRRLEWFLETTPSGYSTQYQTSGADAYQMELTGDLERMVILNAGSSNLQYVWAGNWFPGSATTAPSIAAGQQVYQFSLSANNWIVNASQVEDLLRVYKLTDDAIVFTGVYQRQPPSRTFDTEAFRFAAIEPAEGDFVAAYINTNNNGNEALIFYRFANGTLDRVDQGDSIDTQDLLDIDGRWAISTDLDVLGDMRFLP
ncbi:MAG: IPT/TIG domain-containing protein [Candidatus Sumerlaeia bacterium]